MKPTLCVYDFDHTLVRTSSRIRLSGTMEPIPQHEYEVRVKSKGFLDRSEYNFDDYDSILDPIRIPEVWKSFEKDLQNGEECVILTARHSTIEIAEYLQEELSVEKINVVAVNAEDYPGRERNDAEKKSDYVRTRLKEGFKRLAFYEDSFENAKAVWKLGSEFEDVKIDVFYIHAGNKTDPARVVSALKI